MSVLRPTLTAALVVGGLAVTIAVSTMSRGDAPSVRAAPALASASREHSVPPPSLRATGLYVDWETKTIAPANRPFTPQYPLWSDGARKRRWIYLPAGSAIDATQPDAWQFPVGTRLWKEFTFSRRTETRYMERTAAGWLYATYVWNADETDAVLAPALGMRTDVDVAPGIRHALPGTGDCRACHANGATPVLGFSALQLSPDRDPLAPHREPVAAGALDVPALIVGGQLRGLPAAAWASRIAARTPEERAALGYLHGNCGGCHRADSALGSLGLVLAHSVSGAGASAMSTMVGRESHFTSPSVIERIAPGDPAHSVLVARIGSRAPAAQMPPLGTQLVDAEAVRLITRWIAQLAPSRSRTMTTQGARK